MTRAVYFRNDVAFEPRVNSWYAWPFLIYPPSMGMITKNLHLKLLNSYVIAPHIHQRAAADPSLIGGPFVNYDGDVENVAKFAAASQTDLAELIQLADDIFEFQDKIGRLEGASVEPLYEELPAALTGISEIQYDMRNQPALRLIQALVHRKYNTDRFQSVRVVRSNMDARPFALTSPSFDDAEGLTLRLPLRSPEIDELLEAKRKPANFSELLAKMQRLSGGACTEEMLAALVTEEAPPVAEDTEYRGQGLRVRYFGHASLLIQAADVSIMIDPFVPAPDAAGIPRFTDIDLPPKIDYVLLTHNHSDHVLLETLLQLRSRIGCIVVPKVNGNGLTDPSLRLILRSCGFPNVIEIGELDSVAIPGGDITGIPFLGEHGDMNIIGKLGFAIRANGGSAMFLADSNNLDTEIYRHVAAELGTIDAIFIGMECKGAPMSWLYGSFLSRPLSRSQDQSRRLNGSNCQRAMDLLGCFNPGAVFVYAMGAEPVLKFISSISYDQTSEPIVESNQLVGLLRERGTYAERLYGKREILVRGTGVEIVGDPIPEPF